MFLAELDKVRHASHRAIVVDDLADHSGGLQSGESREVDCRLGLAASFENAARASAKWKNMSRSREVLRMTLWIDGSLDRLCAVISRYPRCYVITLYVD